MKPSPAFQFYPHDFLVGTADLTAEEVGGYIRLLCYQWAKTCLPNDDRKLSQLSGITCSLSLGNVKLKFSLCDDGMIRNGRLEKVRLEQVEYRKTRSICGKTGGNPNFIAGQPNPYYQKDKLEDKLDHKLNINPSSSASSSPISLKKNGSLRGFDGFWERYPKSVAKDACAKIWKSLEFSDSDIVAVMGALVVQIKSNGWDKETKYCPNPKTWLEEKRWEDKVKTNGQVTVLRKLPEGEGIQDGN